MWEACPSNAGELQGEGRWPSLPEGWRRLAQSPHLCLPRLGFLPAGQQASLTLQLIPYKSGTRQLHLTLRSSLFPPLKGHKQLQVAEDGWRTGWLT